MKFYVAAKFERKQEVIAFYEELKKAGHTLASDWTWHKPVSPYNENREISGEYSKGDIEGVGNSDVFVVLGGSKALSSGVCVELGAAIMHREKFGKPMIYVVGMPEEPMFCHHPAVKLVESASQVLEEVGKTAKAGFGGARRKMME